MKPCLYGELAAMLAASELLPSQPWQKEFKKAKDKIPDTQRQLAAQAKRERRAARNLRNKESSNEQ